MVISEINYRINNLVVKRPFLVTVMKNILVAVDFKKNTGRLLKNAALIAEKFNSKIWIIHVAAPDPDFTLLDEAKKLKIDLIIIGMHEHNLLYRAFLKVTSSVLIKKSKIPILVVPLD